MLSYTRISKPVLAEWFVENTEIVPAIERLLGWTEGACGAQRNEALSRDGCWWTTKVLGALRQLAVFPVGLYLLPQPEH